LGVVGDDERQRYAADSRLLGEIGAALVSQNTRLSVRLPAELAAQALAAWHRDETGDVGAETAYEQKMRSHAADVALVGLAIEQAGALQTGPVDIELNAIQVAAALMAHYERDEATPI
jgi:hypothetical protein